MKKKRFFFMEEETTVRLYTHMVPCLTFLCAWDASPSLPSVQNPCQFLPRFTGRAIRVKVPMRFTAISTYCRLLQPMTTPPPKPVAQPNLKHNQAESSCLKRNQAVFRKKRIVYSLGRPAALPIWPWVGPGYLQPPPHPTPVWFHSCPRKRKWGAQPSPVVAFGVPAECISLPMPLSPICQPYWPKANRLDG
jgi:hypothetical protein